MSKLQDKFKQEKTTGFGTRSSRSADRLYKKTGEVNVVRVGLRFFHRFSWYHTLISVAWWKFWLTLFAMYILINLIFGLAYYLIGIENLGNVHADTDGGKFLEAFFLSTQTFTTLGYGRLNPVGFAASAVAAFESFLGVLSFALASGLFYGRFSKPQPYIHFSEKALISPFNEGKGLVFRMVPFKNNHLTDARVMLTLVLRETQEDGILRNEFYSLDVEYERVNALVLNWTVVHPINENSPLNNLTLADLKEKHAEVLVYLRAYDEDFASNVVARTSYTADEIVNNAKFIPMYEASEHKKTTVLYIHKLNDYVLLDTRPV